ncbi:MAG: hypothetical protein HY720_18665 [Planctomycetes bacterium]|nr:hypothetical protein [Planctomycetota bacterium]
MTRPWTWRVGDPGESAAPGLLYEPGNWGDVLKGTWAVLVAGELLSGGARPLRFADPFAGAPVYPLVTGSRERFEEAAGTAYAESQGPFAARGELASSGALVAEVARRYGPGMLDAAVFDADPGRRAAWQGRDGVRVLEIQDGWLALSPGSLADRDLVLLDPYDLDRPENWKPALPRLAALASSGVHLLLYFYNRSPRGPRHLAGYRRFRDALERAFGGEPALLGRVPTDGLFPRAWHEMILVPGRGARVDFGPALTQRLAEATETIAWRIVRPGCVEGGPPVA